MKVRWTQRCAGGCGRWLRVGAHAVRAHRGYWCPGCWARHRPGCKLAHPEPVQKSELDGQLLLPL